MTLESERERQRGRDRVRERESEKQRDREGGRVALSRLVDKFAQYGTHRVLITNTEHRAEQITCKHRKRGAHTHTHIYIQRHKLKTPHNTYAASIAILNSKHSKQISGLSTSTYQSVD